PGRPRWLPPHASPPALIRGSEERVLPLEVTAEPGIAWEGVVALRVTRAVDDRGRRLAQPLPFLGQAVPAAGQAGAVVRVWNVSATALPQAAAPRQVPARPRPAPSPPH